LGIFTTTIYYKYIRQFIHIPGRMRCGSLILDPLKKYRLHTRDRVVLIAILLLLIGVVDSRAFARKTSDTRARSSPVCTATAAEQLPSSLVKSVNAIEAEQNIATPSSNAFSTDLMSRPLRGGGTAQAFANFEPEYCGFDASLAGGALPQDYVVLIRGGHPTRAYINGVCISDTVPTARMVKHVIVMTFRCDRLYANSTWIQTNPRLLPRQETAPSRPSVR
jgi:hypothetical protein